MTPPTLFRAALLSLAVASASAQTPASTDSRYGVDLVVPQGPAFELLDVSDSDILRPSLVRQLAASVGDLAGDDGVFDLPETFGVEVAPVMLLAGKTLSVARYERLRPLATFRLSVATSVADAESDDERRSLALGGRLSLIDNADPRLSDTFGDAAEAILGRIDSLETRRRDALRGLTRIGPPPAGTDVTDALAGVVAGASDAEVAEAASEQIDRYQKDLEALRDAWEAEHWNDLVLEVAAATLLADEAGRDPAIERTALWATLGVPLDRSTFQLLVGGTVRWDDEVEGTAGSAGLRLVGGTSRLRPFVEGRLSFGETDENSLWMVGGEFNVLEDVWLSATAGYREGVEDDLVTRLSIRTALGD